MPVELAHPFEVEGAGDLVASVVWFRERPRPDYPCAVQDDLTGAFHADAETARDLAVGIAASAEDDRSATSPPLL
jgi:hypothetical protein